MQQLCEACERSAVEITETCDDVSDPYLMCSKCHQRLLSQSLRPLEWYNLAKRHGFGKFLLHDDFYDENGEAGQPEIDVENPGNFPIPTLGSVVDSPIKLFDYSATRWQMTPEIIDAWKKHEKSTTLSAILLKYKESKNEDTRVVALEIAARTLGNAAVEFVYNAWQDFPNKIRLAALADASANCLDESVGYNLVTSALAKMNPRERQNAFIHLGYFHTPKALDWIENNIFEPITNHWGYLAAASKVDWMRMKIWLIAGRPLSLVALDTLGAIVRPMSQFLKEYNPKLLNPPTLSEFQEILINARQKDPVPRVQKAVDNLLDHANILTK